jgi:4'-phosphopantetheinyl transferase
MSDPQWLPRHSPLALAPGSLHVWRVSLDLPAPAVERLSGLLSPDELEREAHYRHADLRRRFVVARGALRYLLGAYLLTDPHQVSFHLSAAGKPSIASPESGLPLSFSLSHSGNLALVALAWQAPLGIDLEDLARPIDYQAVAARFFAPAETSRLNELPVDLRREMFLRTWVLKEAYLKALGCGLTRSLDRIEVSITPGEAARLVADRDDPQAPTRWKLLDIDPGSGYTAALAVERRAWHLATFSFFPS